MGLRTVVILDNDQADDWQSDPKLGMKIATAQKRNDVKYFGGYGSIVEVTHADTQSLIVLDSLSSKRLATKSRSRQSQLTTSIDLLKLAAADLGYRLVKKSKGSK